MRWPLLITFLLACAVLPAAFASEPPEIAGLVTGLRIPPGASEVTLDLVNRDTTPMAYDLRVEGVDWVQLEPVRLELAGGERGAFTLVFDRPAEFAEGALTIAVLPESEGVEYAKTLKVRSASTFTVSAMRHFAIIVAAILPFLLSIIIGVALRLAKQRRERPAQFWPARPAPEPEEYIPVERVRKPFIRPVLGAASRKAGQGIAGIARAVGSGLRATGTGLAAAARGLGQLVKRRPQAQAEEPTWAIDEAPVTEVDHEFRQRWMSQSWDRIQQQVVEDIQSRYKLVPKSAFARKREGAVVRWPYATALVVLSLIALTGIYRFRAEFIGNLSYVFVGLGIAIMLAAALTSTVFDRKAKRWQFVPARHETRLKTGWFSGLGEIAFRLFKHGDAVYLRARKARREAAYPVPGMKPYQYFHTEWNLQDDMLRQAEFSFRVPKSWLARHGVTPAHVQLLHHDDGRWAPLDTGVTGDDRRWVYYKARGVTWGQFAITGLPTGFPRKFPWLPVASALAGVLIVGMAALAAGTFVPGQVARETLVPGPQAFDLVSYFPMAGVVGYAVIEEPAHVAIELNGSTATATPAEGWTGEERATFAAYGPDGRVVASRSVRYAVREPFLKGALKNYVWHAAVGAIALILLVLAIEFRKPLLRFMER